MQVNVTFRHMEPTEALKDYARQKIERVIRHVDRATEAHVVLWIERQLQHADITIQAGQFHLRGKEKSEDMYASIDLAMDKIERQLKRYKEKLKNHRAQHVSGAEPVRVRYEVFAAQPEAEGDAPEVIRSDEFLAKPMSVEEAVMQMDLMNNDFIVFTNAEKRGVNVVYRRRDGNYGLIRPPEK
jgi:putative sigma-54 modulation protein